MNFISRVPPNAHIRKDTTDRPVQTGLKESFKQNDRYRQAIVRCSGGGFRSVRWLGLQKIGGSRPEGRSAGGRAPAVFRKLYGAQTGIRSEVSQSRATDRSQDAPDPV